MDLIGRRGREIALGAVELPAQFLARRKAEQIAILVYRQQHPGWRWEAIAL